MMTNKIFRYKVLIKEYHLDTFNHVNNAKYLELLEEARWEFLNEQGFGLKTIQQTGIGPIVLECHISFLKEITLRELIIIESQMMAYQKKIGVMRQDILNEKGEHLCHAKLTFGVFDLTIRKLILPSQEWLQAIGIVVEE